MAPATCTHGIACHVCSRMSRFSFVFWLVCKPTSTTDAHFWRDRCVRAESCLVRSCPAARLVVCLLRLRCSGHLVCCLSVSTRVHVLGVACDLNAVCRVIRAHIYHHCPVWSDRLPRARSARSERLVYGRTTLESRFLPEIHYTTLYCGILPCDPRPSAHRGPGH